MKLTGKCKADFEAWFSVDSENEKGLSNTQISHVRMNKLYMFSSMSISMQWGVFQDFFDSNNIAVEAYKKWHVNVVFYESCVNGRLGAWTSRPEARKAAITEANQLYNNQNKEL